MNEHFQATDPKVTAASQEDTGVLLELNQLQNQKSSWTGMIILFVVSLVLFIGAGAGRWSMNYLIILLGVLFVHEMGHYLAMRMFDYKNVKMFFIPFFGAAVSGQHYNVPGWKKVVVSLMGPVPGIVLGVIIGGVGLVMHQPVLVKIALVSMFLNGFNLLPVLPLDGGWAFHALLFSRHYTLDIVFRVLAALALLASPLVLHTMVLPFAGVLMLVALPLAYRTARVAAALKQQGFSPVSADDQQISLATAQAIIAEIKKSSPQPQSNKTVAQQVLQIFEMLNARPPGWGATICLLFVQGASVAVALVFGLAFFIAQTGSLWNFVQAAAAQPKHSLDLKYSRSWGANLSATPEPSDIIMVATFRNAADAGMMFDSLTNHLPNNMSLTCFGEALLVSMPADRDDLRVHWFNVLTNATKDVFVDRTNHHAAFSLYCVAPDTNIAEIIVSEINGYFGASPKMMAPWGPQDRRLTNNASVYDDRYSAAIGSASRAGLLITISGVSFDRIDSGPRAMALWLQGKGCIGFKYDFLPGMASEGDD